MPKVDIGAAIKDYWPQLLFMAVVSVTVLRAMWMLYGHIGEGAHPQADKRLDALELKTSVLDKQQEFLDDRIDKLEDPTEDRRGGKDVFQTHSQLPTSVTVKRGGSFDLTYVYSLEPGCTYRVAWYLYDGHKRVATLVERTGSYPPAQNATRESTIPIPPWAPIGTWTARFTLHNVVCDGQFLPNIYGPVMTVTVE